MGCFLDWEKRKLENFRPAVSGVPSVGSEAQITYNKRNNTTKQWSPLESFIVWFLCFFGDDSTCRKILSLPTPQTAARPSRMTRGNVSADYSGRYRDIWLTEDSFSHNLRWCLCYDKRSPEANLILSISFYLHAIVGLWL